MGELYNQIVALTKEAKKRNTLQMESTIAELLWPEVQKTLAQAAALGQVSVFYRPYVVGPLSISPSRQYELVQLLIQRLQKEGFMASSQKYGEMQWGVHIRWGSSDE